jgi:hypothetical protein
VNDIHGNIPIAEQMIIKSYNDIQFAYLIAQNPFERVDYDRFQPMINDSKHLKINQVQFEDKNYGPFQGFFSLDENILFAHRFDLDIGQGQSNGEMYLKFTPPSNYEIGILSRITDLDLKRAIPKRFLPQSEVENQENDLSSQQIISGRSNVVINLNQGLVDGRVDITEIGKDQLLTLINITDPNYINDRMNKVRYALGFAYPSSADLSFQKGYMDMGIRLNINNIMNQEFKIGGIPVSPWISPYTNEFVKKTKELPLK